jgi:hypothetical protein
LIIKMKFSANKYQRIIHVRIIHYHEHLPIMISHNACY